MRVVSGTLRGRRFDPPESFCARPTTDFAKENIFNVLCNIIDFEDTCVLDLFGGSGSITYEFASRGCPSVTCVEKSSLHARFIQRTADNFGISDQVKVIRGDRETMYVNATRDPILPGDYIEIPKSTYERFKDFTLFVASLLTVVSSAFIIYVNYK